MIHLHKWIVVEKSEQPSAWDQMQADRDVEIRSFKGGRWMFDRRVRVHYRCEKCGGEKVVVV